MPINPGNDDNGRVIDFSSVEMSAVWEEVEAAGLPVAHHIGESQPKCPSAVNSVAVAMMVNIDSFREMFSKYIFGGILDRHPRITGSAGSRGGIAWVPPALQDAEHVLASYRHNAQTPPPNTRSAITGTPTCAPRSWWTAWGLQQIDEIGNRQGDVVVRLSAQRKHIRLFGAIVGPRWSTRWVPRMPSALSAATSENFLGI